MEIDKEKLLKSDLFKTTLWEKALFVWCISFLTIAIITVLLWCVALCTLFIRYIVW